MKEAKSAEDIGALVTDDTTCDVLQRCGITTALTVREFFMHFPFICKLLHHSIAIRIMLPGPVEVLKKNAALLFLSQCYNLLSCAGTHILFFTLDVNQRPCCTRGAST